MRRRNLQYPPIQPRGYYSDIITTEADLGTVEVGERERWRARGRGGGRETDRDRLRDSQTDEQSLKQRDKGETGEKR